MPFIGNKPTAVPLSGDDIQDGTIGLADLSATGTKDSTTFLRGDNTFASAGTNTPAFLAQRDSSQSITSNTWTKIQYSTEIFDTNSNYDPTTNYRFTPTVAGKYFLKVSANALSTSNNMTDARIAIYKNGSVLIASFNFQLFTSQDLRHVDITTSIIDSANGSSDYYEGYVKLTGSGLQLYRDGSSPKNIHFFGYKIIE